jgi:DNA-binding NarL/FixJ family response regulator
MPLDIIDDALPAERRREAARELVAALRRRRESGADRRPGPSTLVDLAKASRRLRQISRTSVLLSVGCEEAAAVSGLERTVISAVADHPERLAVSASHGVSELAADRDPGEQSYDSGHAELTAVEGGTPVTVQTPSATTDGTLGSLVGHPYVVTPIVHAGQVIGLLHAAHDDGRAIDDTAVAGLTAFASMLSALWYCAAIETSWRDHLVALQQAVTENLDRLADETPDDLGGLDPEVPPSAPTEESGQRPADDLRGRTLTPRERVVLKHLLEGASNREIAGELVLTVDTVKSHVKRILRKLGATNRAELIHRVERHTPST